MKKAVAVSGSPANTARGFAVVFPLLCGVLILAYHLLPASLYDPLNRLTTASSALLLSCLGPAPIVRGDMLTYSGFTVRIIAECSALLPFILYGTFVAAYPAAAAKKLQGLLWGLPILFFANSARIAAVTWCGADLPRYFNYFHTYLGQVFMLLLIVAISAIWVHLAGSERDRLPGARWFVMRAIFYGTGLFFGWAAVNTSYIRCGDRVIETVFDFFNYGLMMPRGHEIYYHTFNVIPFWSLMLAWRFNSRLRQYASLLSGTAFLVALHILFRICNVLMTGFNLSSAYPVSQVISALGQYTLPVGMWLFIAISEKNPSGAGVKIGNSGKKLRDRGRARRRYRAEQ